VEEQGVSESEVKLFMDLDRQFPVVENLKRTAVVTPSTLKQAVENTIPVYTAKNLLYAEVQSHTSSLQSLDECSLGSCSSFSGTDCVTAPTTPTAQTMQHVVISRELLEHYLGMTDPSRAETADSEILKHCTYSLPAVEYTLGRKNWSCIKD